MNLNMYTASVPVFRRMLGHCAAILAKAAQHAETTQQRPADLLQRSLQADMLPLAVQVQILCDGARGAAARLANMPLPEPQARAYAVFNRGALSQFDPADSSFAALQARIECAQAFLDGIDADQMHGAQTQPIVLAMGGQTRSFEGLGFLLDYALPNFYFHASMVYAILRQAGVPLGKRDYEGAPVYASGRMAEGPAP